MDMPQHIEDDDIILEVPNVASKKLAKEIHAATMETLELLKPWLSWARDDYLVEDVIKYLRKWCIANWKEKKGFAYFIRDKKTGQFCGSIDIVRVDNKAKLGEIGYWLAKSAQGKGYMTKAVLLLEKVAFDNGFNRLEIRNAKQNPKSANVAKRAGYHLDGVLRQDRWNPYYQIITDTNVWSKLKSDK